MKELGLLKIGCGRYLFGEGATDALPDEVLLYGKRALVVGGPTTLPIVMDRARVGFAQKEIAIFEQIMDRQNSLAFAGELAELVWEKNIEVIVAIGGGKCMDLCKVLADIAGRALITVPTSIATCAACSAVSIMYTADTGSYDCSVPKNREVDSVIVDVSIIEKSPARLTASGIMDSMAKLPEIVNGPAKLTYPEKPLANYMAYSNSVFTYDFLTRFGIEAYHNPSGKTMLDLINVNLIITSMISGFSSGAGQLAIAHGLYDGMRKYFAVESKNSLHGEIVAVGLLAQMRFNRCEETEYQRVRSMMVEMNMPLTLGRLGVPPTAKNVELLLKYNIEKNNMTDRQDIERLESSFGEIL